MTETILIVVLAIISTIGVGGIVMLWSKTKELQKKLSDKKHITMSEDEAIKKASEKAEKILDQAREKARNIRKEADDDADKSAKLSDEREKRLDDREKTLIDRSKSLDDRYNNLQKQEEDIDKIKQDLKNTKDSLLKELEKIANMTVEEAKQKLMSDTEEELKEYVAKKIKEAEFRIETESENKAKELLMNTMQKSASDYIAETTSTTFEIDKEEDKGKIIGKDGRNIRTFERLTGVDIIIDEAPNQITVSSFDPIRREVAALAMQKLLKDGRVHPGTIETTIQNIKEDLAKEIKKTGEKLAYDAGLSDLPMDIIKLLGRFKYRYSYGQNLAKHSLEMVNIGQQIAQELGANVKLVKTACLLHDLGKVLTHEIEGKPHHHISGDIVRKYLKDEKLANAVEAHHGDIEPKSAEAVVVQIADAISGGRPGARRNNYEDYIQRVSALEEIAKKYKGVSKAYAIHAGREIRVIINPDQADDDQAKILAYKIAKEIEETQNYPGTVKVNVIRETRFSEEAK